MCDNATQLINSACHDCDLWIGTTPDCKNNWLINCKIHGTVEPRVECGDA